MLWEKHRPLNRIQQLMAHEAGMNFLREGNQFLRALLNAIPMPIFYKDTNGRYLGVNKAFESFYGRTEQQMKGKTVFDVAPAEIAAIYQAKDQEFYANPALQIYETKLKNAYGTMREVVFHKAPYLDSGGQLLGMIGVIVDVTKQKGAEREARRGAEVQSVLMQISEATISPLAMEEIYFLVHRLISRVLPADNFYISLLDEQSGVVKFPYCVGKARELPRERSVGRGLTEYVARTLRAGHFSQQDLLRLREQGEVDTDQAPEMEWLGAPLIDLNGKVFGLVVVYLMDQPERFEAEDSEILFIIAAQFSLAIQRRRTAAELIESEKRYRALVNQAPEALLLCDPLTGEIVEVNARFTEQFGYELLRDGPLNVFDLLEEEKDSIQTNLDAAKKNGMMPVKRRIGRHRNGSLVHLERSASLVHYGERQLLLVSIHDVSDEVRREQVFVRESQLASRVQTALLPEVAPSPYLEVVTVYRPQGFVGGDLFFLDWRYQGQLLRGFLIDTAGHGLGTALHTSALHLLLREVNEMDLPLAEQVGWLNRRAHDYFDEASFAAAIAFEIDLPLRKFRWVCAGIPEIRIASDTISGIVARSGMYLGINQEEIFDVHELTISEGDSLYFLTDGLTDRMGLRTDFPFSRFSSMVRMITELAESPERRDDATAVCIRIKSLPQLKDAKLGWPRVFHFNGYGDFQRYRADISRLLSEITNQSHSLP